jgi:hypothetical protein
MKDSDRVDAALKAAETKVLAFEAGDVKYSQFRMPREAAKNVKTVKASIASAIEAARRKCQIQTGKASEVSENDFKFEGNFFISTKVSPAHDECVSAVRDAVVVLFAQQLAVARAELDALCESIKAGYVPPAQ